MRRSKAAHSARTKPNIEPSEQAAATAIQPGRAEAKPDLVDARERDDEGDRQREACRQQRQAAERPEAVAVPRLTGAMVSS
jgi:hypothetical protein